MVGNAGLDLEFTRHMAQNEVLSEIEVEHQIWCMSRVLRLAQCSAVQSRVVAFCLPYLISREGRMGGGRGGAYFVSVHFSGTVRGEGIDSVACLTGTYDSRVEEG